MASLISVGQILDHSLEHCRKHFKELLAITLWMVVASIPSIIGKLLAPSGGNDQILTGGDWLSFGFSLTGTIIVAVVSVWAYVAIILAVAEQAGGKRTQLKTIYQQAWKKFLPYVLLTLTIGLIVMAIALITAPGLILMFLGAAEGAAPVLASLGTPLFLLGGIITLYLLVKYSVQLAFAPYVLLLEDRGVIDSVKASLKYVEGRWWSTFIRFILPKLIYFLVIFIVSFVVFAGLEVLIALLIDTSAFLVLVVYTVSLLLSVFMSAIVTPLIIATDYYLYDSLRKSR